MKGKVKYIIFIIILAFISMASNIGEKYLTTKYSIDVQNLALDQFSNGSDAPAKLSAASEAMTQIYNLFNIIHWVIAVLIIACIVMIFKDLIIKLFNKIKDQI